ncbi:hypothetical protein [Streptomyces sp. NRRL WC-3549]|uniref:hypothetical protein n=1 Tax=Streptomyces sp. NRRL WC-3549 TaxID=1463925 RepID=UPI0004C5D1A7|nr:hypothetical protein [Streptomyces sp. NRRL WC-3549]
MLRRHHRNTVLTAAALMATTLLLTACQEGGADSDSESKGASTSASASAARGKTGDGEKGTDTAEGLSGQGSDSASGEGVTGKRSGTLSYMAPGKYMITGKGDDRQAFFVSEDTEIQGAGKICGDANGQAATPCTEEELEAAAKKGVGASVELKDGIAVSIVEDHADSGAGDNASGLFSGKLGYMAPGKYTLTGNGPERAFFTSTDTTVNGAGWICGERTKITDCTEEELEAAAKKGSVAVVVDIKDGIAVTIDEEHN